jgi:predicted ATPase
MLTELSVHNFKSWRAIERMRFAPFTGLFGANSSGKTGILQLLLLIKQTVDSPDRMQVLELGGERTPVALGTFRDIVHGHEAPGRLSWSLAWRLPKPLEVEDPERRGRALLAADEMRFRTEITENGKGNAVVERLAYEFAGHTFAYAQTQSAGGSGEYHLTVSPSDFVFKRTVGRPWPLKAPIKCYGFPDQVRAYFQNAAFLADFALAFEQFFGRVYYLGPLREYPKRQYAWAGSEPADMGQRGERVIDALLASRERGEKIGRGRGKRRFTAEEYVGYWLRELGLIHDFSVERITAGGNLYQVHVRKSAKSSKVLITDVGFGVSQILPVLALCYYVPRGSVILLEQPEIHLHPSVQAGLADVFLDAIQKRGVQVVLESHSEHLLRRLQRRIAEECFEADDAALYFCQISGGVSRLTPLQLNLLGNIENWPKDFFGDEFAEIAATTRAQINQQKRTGA